MTREPSPMRSPRPSLRHAALLHGVALGLLLCGPALAQSANAVRTTTAYQVGSAGVASNLLPVSVTSGSGDGVLSATVTTTYDAVGNVLIVDGPLPGTADTTRYVYDAMRQTVGTIGPDPDGGGARLFPAVRTTYNANGQVTAVAQGTTTGQGDASWAAFVPLLTATSAYDAQARKVLDTAAAGTAAARVTQYSYDAASRLTCATVRMNPATFGALPASACTLGTAGSFGPDRITLTTYDNADRVVSTVDAYGTPFQRTTMTRGYTPNGQTDWIEDGVGNRSDYVYDGFDRLYRLSSPYPTPGAHAANPADYEEYGYDAASNPVSKRVRSGQVFTTTFDALNRITYVDAPAGTNDTSFTYDLLGRQLSAYSQNGIAAVSTWDALGRQTTETGPLGTVTYQYDLAGRRLVRGWPNGNYVTYAWDLSGAMTQAAVNGWLVAGTLAYDDLGRRTQVTRYNGVTTSYGYNSASQLTALSHDLAGTAHDVGYTFAYTPASQIASRTVSNPAYDYTPGAGTTTYANNGLNQVTSAGGFGVSWDGRGNLTSDSARSYTYDAANRLLSGGTSSLIYDPLDRLHLLTGTGGARFLYDGSQLSGVFDTAGTMVEHWVGGPSPDEWLMHLDGSVWNWPLQDAQGSVVAITDTNGNATAINAYDEYGQQRPRRTNPRKKR